MDNSAARLLKLPVFDGKHAKFQIWWTRFKAYAVVFGYAGAVKIGGEADMPPTEATFLDLSSDDGKKMASALKRNAVAVVNLTMAFTSEGTIALVYEAMNDPEWPSGLAHVIVAALMDKYQPQDTVTRVELRKMLNKVSMKKTENPAVIFEQLSSINNRYNTSTKQIDEEDLIAVVLEVAPKEY